LGLPEIFLRASKPGAIRGSQNVGVEIHRTRTSKPEDLVYFSLGSNLNPAFHLVNALESLDQKFGLKKISHVYETSPVGGKKKQPFFWNLVAGVDTPLKPAAIRQWSSKLEKREGRVRSRDKYISRTLDVDVILWKTLVQKTKTHSLPHPDIQTKAFVLFPLLEITPALTLPDTGEPLIEAALRFHDRSQKFKRLPLSALPNGSRFPMGGVF
jgi:2-amino-4-hydroxy-6-hydroxymethyldihydropteridine diphosphokinase